MPQAASYHRAGPVPPACGAPVSASDFRATLSRLATTVSVITSDGPAGRAGLTCSAVCAVSDAPATLIACVHGKSAANAVIKANGVLCVNSLQAAQLNLSQAFAGIGGLAMPQRFALAEWGVLATGAPLCRDALAAFDCDVVEARDVGTHTVFLAKVVATAEAGDGEPLLYRRRAYATARPLCPAEA